MFKKTVFWFLAVLLIASCFILPSGAFDGNDYGGGGGGDWGGGGGGWDSDSGGSGDGDWVTTLIAVGFFVVIFAVVWIISAVSKKNPGNQGGPVRPSSNEGLHIQLPDRTAYIESIIKGRDFNFSRFVIKL